MATSKPYGIKIFGFLLIIVSIFQLFILATAGFEHYSYLHQQYSKNMIQFRYCISWIIKFVGLALGIGILRLNNTARILAILNSLFIVCTVHLKHSYVAYSRHMISLDELYLRMGIPLEFTYASLTWPALIAQRLIDIIFGLWLVWYFTRPHIRKYFK